VKRIYVVEDFYRMYTETFTHTDVVRDRNGYIVDVTTFAPESVCNEAEVRALWHETVIRCTGKPEHELHTYMMQLMRARIGHPAPKAECMFHELPTHIPR
jgi:hypothetical protein